MSKIRFQVSISLDGFLAGPNQSLEQPLGVGGEQVHHWMFDLDVWHKMQGGSGGITNESSAVADGMFAGVGAIVMGRNMFGGGPGPWPRDEPWRGWWGEDPPYHVPVFVMTHHERAPEPMEGGTIFHFVTGGIDAAISAAREAAGGLDVLIGGGASAIQQALARGYVDEFLVSIAPVLLGSGERLLDKIPQLGLEQIESIAAPDVTHIRYRVVRG
jgi:dihydrofolate reductase